MSINSKDFDILHYPQIQAISIDPSKSIDFSRQTNNVLKIQQEADELLIDSKYNSCSSLKLEIVYKLKNKLDFEFDSNLFIPKFLNNLKIENLILFIEKLGINKISELNYLLNKHAFELRKILRYGDEKTIELFFSKINLSEYDIFNDFGNHLELLNKNNEEQNQNSSEATMTEQKNEKMLSRHKEYVKVLKLTEEESEKNLEILQNQNGSVEVFYDKINLDLVLFLEEKGFIKFNTFKEFGDMFINKNIRNYVGFYWFLETSNLEAVEDMKFLFNNILKSKEDFQKLLSYTDKDLDILKFLWFKTLYDEYNVKNIKDIIEIIETKNKRVPEIITYSYDPGCKKPREIKDDFQYIDNLNNYYLIEFTRHIDVEKIKDLRGTKEEQAVKIFSFYDVKKYEDLYKIEENNDIIKENLGYKGTNKILHLIGYELGTKGMNYIFDIFNIDSREKLENLVIGKNYETINSIVYLFNHYKGKGPNFFEKYVDTKEKLENILNKKNSLFENSGRKSIGNTPGIFDHKYVLFNLVKSYEDIFTYIELIFFLNGRGDTQKGFYNLLNHFGINKIDEFFNLVKHVGNEKMKLLMKNNINTSKKGINLIKNFIKIIYGSYNEIRLQRFLIDDNIYDYMNILSIEDNSDHIDNVNALLEFVKTKEDLKKLDNFLGEFSNFLSRKDTVYLINLSESLDDFISVFDKEESLKAYDKGVPETEVLFYRSLHNDYEYYKNFTYFYDDIKDLKNFIDNCNNRFKFEEIGKMSYGSFVNLMKLYNVNTKEDFENLFKIENLVDISRLANYSYNISYLMEKFGNGTNDDQKQILLLLGKLDLNILNFVLEKLEISSVNDFKIFDLPEIRAQVLSIDRPIPILTIEHTEENPELIRINDIREFNAKKFIESYKGNTPLEFKNYILEYKNIY